MSEKVDQFCEGLRTQLTKVEEHMKKVGESVKAAPGQAYDAICSSIDNAKSQHESNMHKLSDAKAKMESSFEAKTAEVESQIAEWKTNREINKLEKRADNAEDYAVAAIDFAAACVAEADLATLEAVAARIEAEDAKA